MKQKNLTSAGEVSQVFKSSKFTSIDNIETSKRFTSSKKVTKTDPEPPRTPLKASDDFLSIIASRLCLLDNEISTEQTRTGPIDTNDKALKKLKKSYFQFLKNFSIVEGIVDSVFVHSVVLAKKVKKALIDKFEFKQKEFMLIYAGCLFVSIKYVVDSHKWFIEDFSHISKLEEKLIHKMEIFVLETALNFKVAVMNEEFFKEYDKTYRNVERRRARLQNGR
jgi:hypothetical protein